MVPRFFMVKKFFLEVFFFLPLKQKSENKEARVTFLVSLKFDVNHSFVFQSQSLLALKENAEKFFFLVEKKLVDFSAKTRRAIIGQ